MENPIFRLASIADFEKCLELDPYILPAMLRSKITQKHIYVMEIRDQIIGHLRLDWFWSRIPYIALIRLNPEYCGKGYGSLFLNWLERELKNDGYHYLMSSSQSNESSPQNWHLKNKFYSIGQLSRINLDGSNEIFYRKDL